MELNVNQDFLNLIAEKFGMFIDWSVENVYPQIVDILERYRLYELTTNGLEFIVGFILFISGLIIGLSLVKEFDSVNFDSFPEGKKPYQEIELRYTYWRTNYDSDIKLEDMKVGGWLRTWYAAIGVVVGGVIFLCAIGPLVKWIFIPEIMFYQLIVG